MDDETRMRWRPEGDTGATMAEYGIMVISIAIVALIAVSLIGVDVAGMFQSLVDAV